MRELLLVALYAVSAYFIFWNGYDFFLSTCALFVKKEVLNESENTFFYVLIPAYKEGEILFNTVDAALRVDYPRDQIEIVLLAQELEEEVLSRLQKFPITIVRTGALGSKMKAVKNWISTKKFDNECLFILDADNIIKKNALKICSSSLNHSDAVQLERKKSESLTSMGVLDRWNTAVGIALSHHSRQVLGRSTFILGSGFAVKAQLYQSFVNDFKNSNVEDKAFDLYLIEQRKKLIYHRIPGVVDATVSGTKELSVQRSRWVGGRIEARNLFRKAHLKKPWSFELLDKHLHYSAPQRSIRLVGSALWLVLGLYFIHIHSAPWLHTLPMALGALAYIFATPKSMFTIELFYAIAALPKSILIIIKSRLNAKAAMLGSFNRTPK